MYAGFFDDMSTGVTFGFKLPTGTYTAYGLDRDTQIGSGSTDLLLGGFHRGLHHRRQCTGNTSPRRAGRCRSSTAPPTTPISAPTHSTSPAIRSMARSACSTTTWYNVFGFDKITPLAQIIASHRVHDNGPASDPLNTGFDRLMFSPGVEFTKVVDEANNRVLKFYADVEIPFYYRTNAADNGGPPSAGGTEGQLIAPYLVKLITSYNF